MDLIELLRAVKLFSHLDEDYLWMLADICEERVYPAGAQLTRQADLGASFFVIASGEAVIHHVDQQGLQRPVGMFHAGDSFGVTALFLSEPRDVSVMAVSEMRIWRIHRPDFLALLEQHPRLERQLLIPDAIRAKLRAPRLTWIEPGETLVYISRRHWLVFVRIMAFLTVAIGLYVFFIVALANYKHMPRLLLMIVPGLLLYGMAFGWRLLDWRNDYFALTTRRVVHREQVAFVYESRDEAPIDRVQNTNITRDFMGQMLDYGNLTIQTAAKDHTVVFDHVPHPDRMAQAIFAQIERARTTRRAMQRQRIREAIASHLNLELPATPPEGKSEERTSDDALPTAPRVRANPIARAANWMVRAGLLPAVRVETPEAVMWRKHWLFLIEDVLMPMGWSLILGFVTVLGFFGIPASWVNRLPVYPYITFVATLVCMGWFWWQFNDWGNDLYIVSNDRIVDIEKRPLFSSEQRREASLAMVQNVSLKIPGFWATMFDYGNVVVQTAGAGEFTFDSVPNPRDVQREIFRRMEAFRISQEEREAARRRAESAEWFSVYDELHHDQEEGKIQPLHRATPTADQR